MIKYSIYKFRTYETFQKNNEMDREKARKRLNLRDDPSPIKGDTIYNTLEQAEKEFEKLTATLTEREDYGDRNRWEAEGYILMEETYNENWIPEKGREVKITELNLD